jgi:hypothetical protein
MPRMEGSQGPEVESTMDDDETIGALQTTTEAGTGEDEVRPGTQWKGDPNRDSVWRWFRANFGRYPKSFWIAP